MQSGNGAHRRYVIVCDWIEWIRYIQTGPAACTELGSSNRAKINNRICCMMQSTKGALFFVVAIMIAATPADIVAAQPTKMMQGACFLNTTGSTQFYWAKWTN